MPIATANHVPPAVHAPILFDSKRVARPAAFGRGILPRNTYRPGPTALDLAWASGHSAGEAGAAPSAPWHLDGPEALAWHAGYETAVKPWDRADAQELAEFGCPAGVEIRD